MLEFRQFLSEGARAPVLPVYCATAYQSSW